MDDHYAGQPLIEIQPEAMSADTPGDAEGRVLSVRMRKKFYASLQEPQEDLDACLPFLQRGRSPCNTGTQGQTL
jgi:hypothetical protein